MMMMMMMMMMGDRKDIWPVKVLPQRFLRVYQLYLE